eukprot:scaffold3137_cov132-Skeletonema_menzelii.AAC.2
MPPICKDTEALLEIQYWSGHFYYYLFSFRVEDKEGGTVLSGKPNPWMYSLEQSYACLPKDDACYAFLIGGMDQWATAANRFATKMMNRLLSSSCMTAMIGRAWDMI